MQTNHPLILQIQEIPLDDPRSSHKFLPVGIPFLATPGAIKKFGHSKDDPTFSQFKLMAASLDPQGMPVATWVVGGDRADDGLYVPINVWLPTRHNPTDALTNDKFQSVWTSLY